MAFWHGAFEPTAFWTGEVVQNVLDNPVQATTIDFDAPTALGTPSYVARPARAEVTPVGFPPTIVFGFVLPAIGAEIEAEGFVGGLVTPVSYNAIRGDVNVEGRWPGSGVKPGGLLENAFDPDGDSLSFQIMSQPSHGTLQVEFNSAFLYTPNRGFSGTDSFTWRPWANGEAGNTVAVTFLVEENRVVAGSAEVSVQGFAGTQAGSGVNAPADLAEVAVAGFNPTALAAGFNGTATRGDVDAEGGFPLLEGVYQATACTVDVQGFAGTLRAGFINQATTGVNVTVTAFAPTTQIGFTGLPSFATVEVEGFTSTTVGFVNRATVGFVTVQGFASPYLETSLQALLGEVAVVGFAPVLNFEIILPPPAPERPADVTFYDPRNHLPAGRRLTHETEDDLMAFWASVNYRVLTAGEIALICGSALPNPVIKREFGTGEYPVRKTGTY